MGQGASVLSTHLFEEYKRTLITNYLRNSPLAIALEEETLEEFASCFDLIEIKPNCQLIETKPNVTHFYIICEGSMDISVMVKSINDKLDHIREIVCSKKVGDIIYVPAVEVLATSVQQSFDEEYHRAALLNLQNKNAANQDENQNENENEDEDENVLERIDIKTTVGNYRRTSSTLSRLLNSHLITRNENNLKNKIKNNQEYKEKMLKDLDILSSYQTPKSEFITRAQSIRSNEQLSVLKSKSTNNSIHIDQTPCVMSPYGAKLIRLDNEKFENYLKEIHHVLENDYREITSSDENKENMNQLSNNNMIKKKKQHFEKQNKLKKLQEKKVNRIFKLPNLELMSTILTSNIEDYLKRIPFLSNVPLPKLHMLSEMSKFEMFPKGHVICNEKEQGNEVYVVLYGKLEVNKQFQDESYFNNASFVTPPSTSLKNNKSKKMNKEVGSNDVKKSWSFKGMLSRKKSSNSNAHARDTPNSYYLGSLEPGDYFGEFSVLYDVPRQATIKTEEACLLLTISRKQFKNLMKTLPHFVFRSIKRDMRLHMISLFLNNLNNNLYPNSHLNSESDDESTNNSYTYGSSDTLSADTVYAGSGSFSFTDNGVGNGAASNINGNQNGNQNERAKLVPPLEGTMSFEERSQLESTLSDHCEIVEVPSDFVLIKQGQVPEYFYFILHGQVEASLRKSTKKVTKEVDPEQLPDKNGPLVELGELGPGSYFGEVSILTNTRCCASIKTVSRCVLLKVSNEDFQKVWCQIIPEFRAELLVRIYSKHCRIDHVFNHQLTKTSFGNFLKTEHSYENFDFLLHVDNYRKLHKSNSVDENLASVRNIMQLFISCESVTEVNISDNMVRLCIREYERASGTPLITKTTTTDTFGMDMRNTLKATLSTTAALEEKEDNEEDILIEEVTPMTTPIRIIKTNPDIGIFDKCEQEVYRILELGGFTRYVKSDSFIALLAQMRAYDSLDLTKFTLFTQLDTSHTLPSTSKLVDCFAPPLTRHQQSNMIVTSSVSPKHNTLS